MIKLDYSTVIGKSKTGQHQPKETLLPLARPDLSVPAPAVELPSLDQPSTACTVMLVTGKPSLSHAFTINRAIGSTLDQDSQRRTKESWARYTSLLTLYPAVRGLNFLGVSNWVAPTVWTEATLRQRLSSYTSWGENWDGEGARPPSENAVSDALTFLDGMPDSVPIPYPEVGAEGEVGVYWDLRNVQRFVEVTFDGDGTFAYFAVHGAPGEVVQKCGKDGEDVKHPWPNDMLRILGGTSST